MSVASVPVASSWSIDLQGRTAALIIRVNGLSVIDIVYDEGARRVTFAARGAVNGTPAILGIVNREYRAWADYLAARLIVDSEADRGDFSSDVSRDQRNGSVVIETKITCDNFTTKFEYDSATSKIVSPARGAGAVRWGGFLYISERVDSFLKMVDGE